MYVNATIKRMVKRIASIPQQRQSHEFSRLHRYCNHHRAYLDETVIRFVEQQDLESLLEWTFSSVLEDYQPTPGSVGRVGVFNPNLVAPETDVEAETLLESESETNLQSDTVQSESEDEALETIVVETPVEAQETEPVESSDEPDPTEEATESVDAEPAEPIWNNRLRQKLLKLQQHKKRDKKHNRREASATSRWEFWHENAGLVVLSAWLSNITDTVVRRSLGATIDALENMEIQTVADLVLTPPVEYQKIPFTPIDAEMTLGMNTVRGQVCRKYIEVSSPLHRWVVELQGKSKVPLLCTWVGKPPRGWDKWRVGANIGFVGEVLLDERLELKNAEPVGVDGRGSGILSVYDLEGVSDVDVRDLMAQLLMTTLHDVQDSLPKEVLEQSSIMALGDALREAHFPANQNHLGRSRLAFEEIFLYHIGKRLNSKFSATDGVANKICHYGLAQLSWMQNIVLSDAQEVVLSEIRREMLQPRPMRRLIQGDVGTGKPMVAMFAALSLFSTHTTSGKGGGRNQPKKPLVVYLCDDELSAERRFVFMEESFKQLGIQCKLMTQKPNKADFNILETDGGLVVVTEEVLQTKFQALSNIRLVIVEENQRVGQNIPYGFLKRSPSPDLLVFTPTPQPIDILETVYADFALSTIQLPDVRLPECAWSQASERTTAYAKLLTLVQQGRQGLIVWPTIDGKDMLDIQQALQAAGAIQKHYLPEVRIGIYCSAMKTQERMKVFEEFKHKRIDVLLCTTVIEDTPAVENTTMVIVEKAEMSDAIRLHRLRGHLVKSHYSAMCHFIVSDDATQEQKDLVDLMCQETDGLALAEKVSAVTESLELRWANKDAVDLRLDARNLAHQLSLRDLKRCRWPLLNNAVRHWWSDFSVPDQRVKNTRQRYRKKRRS